MMGGPSYSLTLHGDLSVYGYDHAAKMSGAKFVCAVGNHLVEQIVDQVGIPKARLFSSFMGVRTDALTAVSDGRVYDREGLHLVTVARLNQNKGHFHALAAIHQAKKSGLVVHYTMAGEGPYRDAITSRIEELGLEAETTLMGTVSEADVFQLLSRADTFVLPSVGLGEAWPVSVMEAMSAGLPVIASTIGATPEMITDGIDGFLVPQGAEKALLELVTRLHNDHDMRRKIGSYSKELKGVNFNSIHHRPVSSSVGLFSKTIIDRFSCECVAVEPAPVPFSGIPDYIKKNASGREWLIRHVAFCGR
jgi:glycosyltransferase involved in cell wall biosynthesis